LFVEKKGKGSSFSVASASLYGSEEGLR